MESIFTAENVIAVEVLRLPSDVRKRNHSLFRSRTPGLYLSGFVSADETWRCHVNHGTRPVIFKIERIDIPATDGEKKWPPKQSFQNPAEDAYM